MMWIMATRTRTAAMCQCRSKPRARRRLRLIHPMVRSTVQRLGGMEAAYQIDFSDRSRKPPRAIQCGFFALLRRERSLISRVGPFGALDRRLKGAAWALRSQS